MSDAENNVAEQNTGEKMEEETDAVGETEPSEEEQTEADQSTESAPSPSKSPAKSASPKKTPQKRKADTDQNGDGETKEDGDDEDEESSDEELVGLLDGPVKLMTGKRERKKTQRLSFDTKKEVSDTKFEVEEGRGTKLGDMPNVEFYISKTNSENFKALYRFFFGRPGRPHDIKRNIRKFSGFNFEKGSPEYNKKEAVLIRYTMLGLREICLWLDLDRKGSKEEILDRILSFCLKPEPSGRPHPQKKRKPRVLKKKGKKRKLKADASGDAPKAKKAKTSKKKSADEEDGDEEESGDEQEEADDEGEEETAESEDGDQEEEAEEPKKKKAKVDKPSPKKKAEKKKPEKKKMSPKSPKKTPKKTPVKKSTPKKKASIQITPKSTSKGKAKKLSIEDSDDSSDDEPLIRKAEPSEAQIEQTIKSFLDKADLELVTMKMVCKKVYETYPDFNLLHKKDFIKATVRSIIS